MHMMHIVEVLHFYYPYVPNKMFFQVSGNPVILNMKLEGWSADLVSGIEYTQP